MYIYIYLPLAPPQLLEKDLVLEEVTAIDVAEYMYMCICIWISLSPSPLAAREGPCARGGDCDRFCLTHVYMYMYMYVSLSPPQLL